MDCQQYDMTRKTGRKFTIIIKEYGNWLNSKDGGSVFKRNNDQKYNNNNLIKNFKIIKNT